MSNHVVHFTKPYANQTPYNNMLGILGNRIIRALNPFGFVREKAPDPATQIAVCFSELPLHLLGRLAEKRSEYGIVFSKKFVLQNDANPILYAYKDNSAAAAIRQLVEAAKNNSADPIWELTPFVDAPGAYGQSTYYFEWEREWRKVGDLMFKTDDVAFLIIPEHLHIAARTFFDDARAENTGPSYDCPFIDAHWPIEKIQPLLPEA